ncbi:MAG: DUF2071 domain-containing protein, partial [Acidimicrobiia bacterium]|nr:DUF2071 domain-containing protein [Acidimicrobiia bacterium]
QAWRDISFLHWALDPDELQYRLPHGLSANTFDGCVWLSLSPFRVVDQAPFVLPAIPVVSSSVRPACHLRHRPRRS